MNEPLGNYQGWHCVFSPDGIVVSTSRKSYGKYKLLIAPYCEKCSLPGVATDRCPWHWKNVVERTYAMGAYLSTSREESKKDLLSKHILGLKQYVSYSVPLGLAMSLCVDKIYPELREVDMLVPVPKHPDELKVDQESQVRYNQAEELARMIGRNVDLDVANALVKTRPLSQKQQGGWRSRIEVPDGVYAQNADVSVRSKSILLIDDVRTSGGTMSACASVLLNNGAKRVNSYVAGREAPREWTPPGDVD